MKIMSNLLVVVKSHLFPKFVLQNREIGTSRGHWGERRVCGCQSRVGGHGTRELHIHIGGAAAVDRDGRAIHRKRGGSGSYSQL